MSVTVADQLDAAEIFNRCMRIVSYDQIWTARLETGEFDEEDRDTLAEIGYRIAAELEYIVKNFSHVRAVLSDGEEEDKDTAQAVDSAVEVIVRETSPECSLIARKIDEVKRGEPTEGDIAKELLGAVMIAGGFVVGGLGRWLYRHNVTKSDADTNALAAALMGTGTALLAIG